MAPVISAAEEARQKQVSLVGSDQLYIRLDSKLANLKIDQFFYSKQLKLMAWRWRFLEKIIIHNFMKLSFLSTQPLEETIAKLESPDFSSESSEMYLERGLRALNMFVIPEHYSRYFWSFKETHYKEDGPCECQTCKTDFNFLKLGLQNFPNSAAFITWAICSSSVWTLKDMCMAKVLELGLSPDWLPLSVQKTMEEGPELAEVDRRTMRCLDFLQKARIDMKDL